MISLFRSSSRFRAASPSPRALRRLQQQQQRRRSCVERLEHRTLLSADTASREPVSAQVEPNAPSADISVQDVGSRGDTTHVVTVVYDDESGVNPASIDTSDITVERDGSTLNVTEVSVSGDGTARTAVYTVQALGGAWDTTDNGTYTVTVNADAVQDNAPEANGNAAASATFAVNVDPPLSVIAGGLLTTAGPTTTIEVVYNSDVAVDQSTIGANDISVGSSGNVEVTNAEVTGSSDGGKSVTVIYTVQGPGGSWDSEDNGEYEISINPGSVRDASGAALSGPSDFLGVDIDPPAPSDTTKPVAVISAVGDVTAAGGSALTVTVRYTDDTAIDLETISTTDITVSKAGPGGDLDVTDVSTQVADGGKTVTATYTVAAPGGTFDAGDNGVYGVEVEANAVRDTAGNGNDAAGGVGFLIDIPAVSGPGDTTPPTASIDAADVDAPGGATHAVSVTYNDDVGIDLGSIGVSDLSVSGGIGVTGFSTEVSNGGKTVVATYTLAAPGGSFDSADNGTYTVTLNATAVRDTSGNAAASVSDDFLVNVAPPPPAAQAGPLAAISASDVTAPGAATTTVTVVFTDDDRIRVNSIDADDLVVSLNGGGPLAVTGVQTISAEGGRHITAVYTIAAPGGSWDAGDNGTYTITLDAGAVIDARGNGSAAAAGSFTVNASGVDTADPTAGPIGVGNVTTEGVTELIVTIAYADDAGIDFTSIGTDDVTVTGPAGTLAVNVVDVAQAADGKGATVTYTFAAPAEGGFAFAHNGTYTVSLNAGAVRDTAGKGVAASSTAFQVAVPEPAPIDPGFGNGNAVTTDFVVEAVATGAGERLLVAGRTSGGRAVLEVRNADGTLDTSFNKTGQLVSATDVAYYAVVAQGDKIVVAGTANGDLVLVRYLADGRLDATFGANGTAGRVFVDFGQPNDAAYALALAPDGKLVAAGQSDGNFAIARFDADGRLDPTFASGGMAFIDLGANDLAGSVAVQTDGKIVLAGTSGTNVVVVRLQANGMDDSAAFGSASPFSGDGALTVGRLVARDDPGMPDRSIGLALQADGKILVGNHTAGGTFGVVRISTSGNIDSSFGDDGLATANVPGAGDDVDAIVVQPTGEILAVGTSLDGGLGRTSVAAFSTGGEAITSFGTAGVLTLDSGVVPPARELRIGDLVLRAFGTRQPNGRIVVGTSNGAPQAPQQGTQSALRRLNVPGTRSVAAGAQLGSFGVVNGGRPVKYTYTDADGTKITFTVRGGTGTAFLGADNRINLVINDGGAGATVTIRGRGGDGRIAFGDITSNGTVKSMSVKNGDLSGTFSAAGGIGRLALGAVTGTIASAGSIGSVVAASLTGAKLLAGANLGADAEFGGAGASADSYAAARIGKLTVGGQIVGSTVGAGLDPVDATFLDDDDRVVGGAASMIKSITAKGADEASRFLAGAFGKVKLGAKVTPAIDDRFRVLQ